MHQLAIIIPAYKPTYLRHCLESIANQRDKRFHVYIGNDCSPYDLESIVEDFTDKIPLSYHRFETNLGGRDLVAQWKRCIELSKDESYIWLFSDDDIMDSQCVASFYALEDRVRDNALIHFNIKMIDDLEGGIVKDLPRFPQTMSAGQYLEFKLRGKIVSYVVEFIFPRSLYDKVNGFQNFDLAWGSDFMTWLKMAANSKLGIYTIEDNNSYVRWRRSGENISPDKSKPILIRKLKSLIENASFIKNQLELYPEKYTPLRKDFRWIRFPLGEIYRNRKLLSRSEIIKLSRKYGSKVGYHIRIFFTCGLTLLMSLKRK